MWMISVFRLNNERLFTYMLLTLGKRGVGTISVQSLSVKRGVSIEVVSICWMIVEAIVALGAGITAHSLALVAFGADSIIELVARGVLLWRLLIEMNGGSLNKVRQAEKTASWIAGVSLLMLAAPNLGRLIHRTPTTIADNFVANYVNVSFGGLT